MVTNNMHDQPCKLHKPCRLLTCFPCRLGSCFAVFSKALHSRLLLRSHIQGNSELYLWFWATFLTSTPQLPFKRPQISSNGDHKALNRGTSGGVGKLMTFGRSGLLTAATKLHPRTAVFGCRISPQPLRTRQHRLGSDRKGCFNLHPPM